MGDRARGSSGRTVVTTVSRAPSEPLHVAAKEVCSALHRATVKGRLHLRPRPPGRRRANHRGLLRVRQPTGRHVINHTNMYWTWQAGPERTASVVEPADASRQPTTRSRDDPSLRCGPRPASSTDTRTSAAAAAGAAGRGRGGPLSGRPVRAVACIPTSRCGTGAAASPRPTSTLPLDRRSRLYGLPSRHLIPGTAVKLASASLRSSPTPLLEEERRRRLAALIAERPYPFDVDWARTWPALAAGNDHPMPSRLRSSRVRVGVRVRGSARQRRCGGGRRFGLHSLGARWRCPTKRSGSTEVGRRERQPASVACQHLERVLLGGSHYFEDPLDEVRRHLRVEEVAHRVHENEPGLPPSERQVDLVLLEGQFETGGVSRVAHGLETRSEALGVAVVAAGAHLRAAGDGVPGGLRPLDGGTISHRPLRPNACSRGYYSASGNRRMVPDGYVPRVFRGDDSHKICPRPPRA